MGDRVAGELDIGVAQIDVVPGGHIPGDDPIGAANARRAGLFAHLSSPARCADRARLEHDPTGKQGKRGWPLLSVLILKFDPSNFR
jgi:hypothetical protein